MSPRENTPNHRNVRLNCIKVILSIKSFFKKTFGLTAKIATVVVIMTITGLIIFGFYLGLLQFAFIILC